MQIGEQQQNKFITCFTQKHLSRPRRERIPEMTNKSLNESLTSESLLWRTPLLISSLETCGGVGMNFGESEGGGQLLSSRLPLAFLLAENVVCWGIVHSG